MERPKETDEPKPDLGGAAGPSLSPQAARHLAQVESDAALLTTMAPDALRTRLHEIIAGATPYSAEALVGLCRFAHERRDRRLMNLAAAALVKVATPSSSPKPVPWAGRIVKIRSRAFSPSSSAISVGVLTKGCC